MLSIMRCLEDWRHYLEGAKERVEIFSDHKNLQYFLTSKKLNRRQARLCLFLSRFDFLMTYKKGTLSTKVNLLSRRSDHDWGKNDNENIILLKPEYFCIAALSQGHVLINAEEAPLLSAIRKSKGYDESIVKAIEDLKKSSTKRLRSDEWQLEQDLILFRGKVYVPKNDNLRQKVVKLHHNSFSAGHPRQWKTIELITRNYWWPGLSRFTIEYVKECDTCNRTKTFPEKPVRKLLPLPIPNTPWKSISSDMIVSLPESQGCNAILVVADRFTKEAHFIPCTNETSTLGLATLFHDNVWKLHGLPDDIVSDRGPNFTSALMKELNKLLGIKTKLSTAYHPQTDGQTERINQDLELFLRIFINHRQSDWFNWISIAEFSYNNKVHSSTKFSPFYLNSGFNPRMGVKPIRDIKHKTAADFTSRMKSVREEAEAALTKASDEMKRFADFRRGDGPTLKVGDKVYVDASDYTTDRPSKKLRDRKIGPYPILEVINDNAFKLKLPSSMKIHPVFTRSKLRLYSPPTIPGQSITPQGPVIIEGEECYNIEAILNSKLTRGKLFYLVKWEGWSTEHNTWEPKSHLDGSRKFVEKFHQEHPSAPRRIFTDDFKNLTFRKSKTSLILKSPLLQSKLPDLFLSNPTLKDESEPNQRTWYSTLNLSSFPSFSTKLKITNSTN